MAWPQLIGRLGSVHVYGLVVHCFFFSVRVFVSVVVSLETSSLTCCILFIILGSFSGRESAALPHLFSELFQTLPFKRCRFLSVWEIARKASGRYHDRLYNGFSASSRSRARSRSEIYSHRLHASFEAANRLCVESLFQRRQSRRGMKFRVERIPRHYLFGWYKWKKEENTTRYIPGF